MPQIGCKVHFQPYYTFPTDMERNLYGSNTFPGPVYSMSASAFALVLSTVDEGEVQSTPIGKGRVATTEIETEDLTAARF